ncbi:hypothetical protein LTR39_002509, partial [Cryomyces antarcticus]
MRELLIKAVTSTLPPDLCKRFFACPGALRDFVAGVDPTGATFDDTLGYFQNEAFESAIIRFANDCQAVVGHILGENYKEEAVEIYIRLLIEAAKSTLSEELYARLTACPGVVEEFLARADTTRLFLVVYSTTSEEDHYLPLIETDKKAKFAEVFGVLAEKYLGAEERIHFAAATEQVMENFRTNSYTEYQTESDGTEDYFTSSGLFKAE